MRPLPKATELEHIHYAGLSLIRYTSCLHTVNEVFQSKHHQHASSYIQTITRVNALYSSLLEWWNLRLLVHFLLPVMQTALLRRMIMFLCWCWNLNYEVRHTACGNHVSLIHSPSVFLFPWLSRGLCMIAWMSVSPQRCIAIVHLSLLHLCNCMHEVSTVNPSCWQVVCSCSTGYSGKPLAEGYWFFLSWQTR